MPHILIEQSSNISSRIDLKCLMRSIRDVMVDVLTASVDNCKIRSIVYDHYLISSGEDEQAFIAVQISILPGREAALLKKAEQFIMQHIKHCFNPSSGKFKVHYSVEIKELSAYYSKSTMLSTSSGLDTL